MGAVEEAVLHAQRIEVGDARENPSTEATKFQSRSHGVGIGIFAETVERRGLPRRVSDVQTLDEHDAPCRTCVAHFAKATLRTQEARVDIAVARVG